MSTITPNLPELKWLNEWVQQQDKLEPGAGIWYQREWVILREDSPMCQTAYCVCGMAIIRAGHEFTSSFDSAGKQEIRLDGRYPSYFGIIGRGASLLGLDESTAMYLFDEDNDAADIDRIIREIFIDAGVDYDSVEPAPDLEIEIKAAEAVRPQLLPEIVEVAQ